MESPKGSYRLIPWSMIGFIVLIAVTLLDPNLGTGWLTTSLTEIGKGLLAVGIYYWLLRAFLHIRTHEVIALCEDKTINSANLIIYWNMVLMVSVAIVFGLAIS